MVSGVERKRRIAIRAACAASFTLLAGTSAAQQDLVVFLESLSTFSNPWRPDDGGQCY